MNRPNKMFNQEKTIDHINELLSRSIRLFSVYTNLGVMLRLLFILCSIVLPVEFYFHQICKTL